MTPEEQYQKILAGRKYLETVLKEVRCGEWYYGHYHQHYSGSYGEVLLYKGLGLVNFIINNYTCVEISTNLCFKG